MRLTTINKTKRPFFLSFSNLSIGVRRFGLGIRRLPTTVWYSIARPNVVVPIVEEEERRMGMDGYMNTSQDRMGGGEAKLLLPSVKKEFRRIPTYVYAILQCKDRTNEPWRKGVGNSFST